MNRQSHGHCFTNCSFSLILHILQTVKMKVRQETRLNGWYTTTLSWSGCRVFPTKSIYPCWISVFIKGHLGIFCNSFQNDFITRKRSTPSLKVQLQRCTLNTEANGPAFVILHLCAPEVDFYTAKQSTKPTFSMQWAQSGWYWNNNKKNNQKLQIKLIFNLKVKGFKTFWSIFFVLPTHETSTDSFNIRYVQLFMSHHQDNTTLITHLCSAQISWLLH